MTTRKTPIRKQNIKYGLFCYDTNNIGDEIQSLAAMRFLPTVDYYINRDNIDKTLPHLENEEIKLIMNGWYIEPSKIDSNIHWPPKKIENFNPLITSLHVSFLNGSKKIFSSKASRDFLNNFAPIGARDQETYNFLNSIGIPSYFSGCLTLTLLPDKKIKKRNYIVAVDIDDDIYKQMASRTKRDIIRIDNIHSGDYTVEQRLDLAKYWLHLFQSAHCIVTTRLHVMLPSLAMGTPVIAINARDKERFSGLIDLTNNYSKSEFIRNKGISLDDPLPNPSTFKPIRDKLINTCSNFTGFDSHQSYLYGDNIDNIQQKASFISSIINSINNAFIQQSKVKIREQELSDVYNNLDATNKKLVVAHKEVDEFKKEINELNKEINELNKELLSLKNPNVKNATKTLLRAIKKRVRV